MKKYTLIILAAVILISCKTNDLYINVLQPAPVTITPDIKNIGIINRSIPTDETKLADIIDKTLSLEGVDLDKDGAMESIKGLRQELLNNHRFDEIMLIDNIEFRASRIGLLPLPLSWEIVAMLCNEYKTDALFALEKYDTDTRLNYSVNPLKLGNLSLPENMVTMETVIKTGWRIYDPARRLILDEFSFKEALVYEGQGINPVTAVEGLLKRKEAIKEVSNIAGQKYATRILPYNFRVTREYFVKGTDNFKLAKRKARTGKWNEAGMIWENELLNPKRKIAGRACYNMAIINEINGFIDEAIGWAQKSYEDYRIRKALRYFKILEGRKYDREVLRLQEEM